MIVESKPVKSNFTGTREKETIKTRKTPVPKKFDLTGSFKSSNKNTLTKGTSPTPPSPPPSLSVKSGEIHFKMNAHLKAIRAAISRINNELNSIDIIKNAPPATRTKNTWNRDAIIFDGIPVISKEQIDSYKRMVDGLPSKDKPKAFLKEIYNDYGYSKYISSKRGSQAKNWKKNGEWKCNSLKYINSIYQTMGHKEWSDNGKHGKQSASIHNQCGAFTKVGNTRCKRQCCSNSTFCTQHTNRYKQ